MKKYLSLLLILSFCFSVGAQKYSKLPEEMKDEVSRSEYREAKAEVKESESKSDEITIPELERIFYNEETAASRTLMNGGYSIESIGKSILYPESVRAMAVSQCGNCIVNILIADSGVDPNHPAYAGDHWYPAANYSGDPNKHWHGTHVGGTAFSLVEEVLEVHDNFRFKDGQILGSNGGGSFANAINMELTETEFFRPMLEAGEMLLINESFGAATGKIAAYENARKAAEELGVIHVTAAGNMGREIISYPAGSDYGNAIGALTSNLQPASFTNRGDYVDFAAPGVGINGPIPGGGFADASGTSMATPLVTGLMALAAGKHCEKLEGKKMGQFFEGIATDLAAPGKDKHTGHGIVFAVKMLEADPCDYVDCEDTGEPEEPEEPEEPQLSYAVSDWSGYQIRWKMPGEPGWRVMYIPGIRVEFAGEGYAEAMRDDLSAWLQLWFNNSGIELAEGMSGPELVWWVGQFIEYAARDVFTLDVVHVLGIDEQQREWFAEGFDRAESDVLAFAESVGVKLVDLRK